MESASIDIQLTSLPSSPGVYQFYDSKGTIIYIGKAKNLKKRVSSYFAKKHDDAKTRILVSKIQSIKHIVVPTETDALLLENNLIKKNKPRYNILLKDDKTYPWICIAKEPYPRVYSTRKLLPKNGTYFGPYTNPKTIRALLELIHELYPLRSCNYDLSASKVEAKSYKRCLEYHMGNCKAPCEGLQTEAQYGEDIKAVQSILKGKLSKALKLFKHKMLEKSERMEFEEAQLYKEKLELLSKYQSKRTVVNPKIDNVDVFSIIVDQTHAYVNYLEVVQGAIIRSHTLEIKKKLNETQEQLLEYAILAIKEKYPSISKEIYLPFEVLVPKGLKITIPKTGDKKRLIELSHRNALFYRKDVLTQLQLVNPDKHVDRIMAQMKKDLRLSEEPRHIECFDNSNIQGTNPVAACVVFKDGKPSKKDYRHFKIKTVVGPDDFASMEEVVLRRYKRLQREGEPLPQLIVIDGGKGQLSSALKALEQLGLRGTIAIIGIAKRLEEIYFPGDSIPLYLDKKSESLKIVQRLRNEAHRFGITFHRNLRSKSAFNSELESIEGIGPKTVEQLLSKYKSLSKIRELSVEELIQEVGPAKATLIFNALHSI